MHHFSQSLRQSHDVPDSWWERMYRIQFHNFHAMTVLKADGLCQRAGIDRIVTLSTGKPVYIDEKIRTNDYGDILLEVWSDKARRIPGWVCKETWADFIAYAVPSASRCHFLPVLQLQSAWKRHSRDWLNRYKTREAINSSWVTVNIAVPYDELFMAIDGVLHVIAEREPGDDDG